MNSNNLLGCLLGWGDEMINEECSGSVKKTDVWKQSASVSCLDNEEFPSLNFKEVRTKKRVHNSIDKEDVKSEENKENKEKLKTVVCKNIKEGKDCTYGNKCIYAHYLEDLTPNMCGYNENCYRVKYNKNVVRNIDNKNPCIFIHPNETIEMFAKRQGAKPELMRKPDPSVVYKNTRMCHSVLEGKICENLPECTYAHKIDELKISPCVFGNECHHVIKNDGIYSNKEDSTKKCFYLHPEEDKKNYKKRVIDTTVVGVKRDAEVLIENIDTSAKKKTKIEQPKKSSDIEEVLNDVKINTDDCVVIETSKENSVMISNTIIAMINSGVKNIKIKIT